MTEGKPCWDLLLLAGALSLDSFAGDLSLFLRLPRLSIDCYIIVTLAAIVSLLHLRIKRHFYHSHYLIIIFRIGGWWSSFTQAGGPHLFATYSIRHTYTHKLPRWSDQWPTWYFQDRMKESRGQIRLWNYSRKASVAR